MDGTPEGVPFRLAGAGGGSGGDSWYAGVWRRGEEGDLARARYPALVFVMKLRKKDGAPGMYADITRGPSPRCGLAVRSTGSDPSRSDVRDDDLSSKWLEARF